jgi:outer membrane protein TolC
MPKIDLYANIGASYGTSSFDNMFSFSDSWFGLGTIGLRLNVPIFDGFRKRSIVQQKQFQQKQVAQNMELVKNQIDLEKLQSEANLTTSIENLKAQRENMALAEEVYRITKIKYEEGVGSNIEVLDADASYKEAQTNYYAALYDALIASVDVETAYGKLLENEND